MTPKTIDEFGGPYADEGPVDNPETQMAADYGNQVLESVAQLTRTNYQAIVKFTCDAGAGVPIVYAGADVDVRTVWGDGASFKPTVTKTADPGEYTIAFAATYNDGLGDPETVGFFAGHVDAKTSTDTDQPSAAIISLASNSIDIVVYDAVGAGARALADDAASTDLIEVTLYLT